MEKEQTHVAFSLIKIYSWVRDGKRYTHLLTEHCVCFQLRKHAKSYLGLNDWFSNFYAQNLTPICTSWLICELSTLSCFQDHEWMCDHEPPFGFPRIQWLENRPAVCALNIPNLPGFAHIDKYYGKLIFQEVKYSWRWNPSLTAKLLWVTTVLRAGPSSSSRRFLLKSAHWENPDWKWPVTHTSVKVPLGFDFCVSCKGNVGKSEDKRSPRVPPPHAPCLCSGWAGAQCSRAPLVKPAVRGTPLVKPAVRGAPLGLHLCL